MPIVTPRNVAMSDGKFEVSIYRGATDDRVEFGVTAKALVDQDNDWEHWAGSQLVQIGDRFRRRVYGWNGTDWTRRDGWQFVSRFDFAALEPVRFNPEVEAVAAAGQPMVDRVGLPLFIDEDGDGKAATRPNQPASGAPARDQWTGALIPGQLQP